VQVWDNPVMETLALIATLLALAVIGGLLARRINLNSDRSEYRCVICGEGDNEIYQHAVNGCWYCPAHYIEFDRGLIQSVNKQFNEWHHKIGESK
jgi:hypothetical protein